MTTSGTKIFNMEVAEIVEEALERIGGNPTSGEEAASARKTLNLLLIHLVNLSPPLSVQKLRNFTTVLGQASYTLPTDCVNVLVVTYADGTGKEIELRREDMMEYTRLYDKSQQGRPTTFYIQRERDDLKVFLWPMPDAAYTINYWATTKIEDITDAVNNLDLPTIYLPAVISGLAYLLSFKRRNIDANYRAELKATYDAELKAALEEDRTRVNFFVRPKINSGV
jgi:hypothetical protein